MTSEVAHSRPLLRSVRAGLRCCIAALVALLVGGVAQEAAAGETRTISFHHTHTNEDLTITYKVNGRYDEEALKRINHILRDWRKNEPIKMDPEVIDLLWEVHRETGSREPIWVVCGYRSPETNSMLRRRSSGVAQHSQHMLGKAIDFYIPGVSVEELRAAGLRAQRGGVGYYPSSNFVHLDTGGVRHWPRMPEAQLAKVLAKGQLASHNASDDRSAGRVTVAQADVARSSAPAAAPSSMPSFLSKLFVGSDEHENDGETAAAPTITAAVEAPPAPAAPKIARAAMAARATGKSAAVSAAPEPRREKIGAIPTPTARPVKAETYQVASAGSTPVKPAGFEMASATSTPVQLERIQLAQAGAPAAVPSAKPEAAPAPVRPAQAASLVGRATMTASAASANDVINDRGYWQGLPAAETAQTTVTRPAPPARRAAPERVAAAELAPWPLASRGSERTPSVGALSYAAAPSPAASRVGAGNTRAVPIAADGAAIVAMGADEQPPATRKGPDTVQAGDRFNDPWMRAMMMAPSAQSFLHTTLYGLPDFRTLGPMFAKPASALAIKFAGDPTGGMSTERFSGSAVAFTPTVNFAAPRTASLR